jgi:hypothetical protein
MNRLIIFLMSVLISYSCIAASNLNNLDQKNLREQFFMIKKATSSCIKQLKSPQDDLIIHEQIFAPLGKINKYQYLFDSEDTLSEEQVEILKNYVDVRRQCRFYYYQMPLKEMVQAYVNFYAEMDKVYDGLISKDLTIGVANQKRFGLNESLQKQFNAIFNDLPK